MSIATIGPFTGGHRSGIRSAPRETDRVPEDTAQPATFAELFDRIAANVATVIRGKPTQVRLATLCLIAEGHLLLEDVPGVGKTSLAKALARSVAGTFGRIQFTPDLLPTDVIGTSVWNQQAASFEFRPGPVFANILLADEINRASPKTQSALLEAMAEEQVTVDGGTRPLARPFMVIATQNPIEHQGTYPLPESQLDRFLMQLSIGYPDPDHERELLAADGADRALAALPAVVSAEHVTAMADYARNVHVGPALVSYLLDLAHATRRHRHLQLGMSPRAVLGLQRAVRVLAAAEGRSFATPDDVKALAPAVVAHRLILTAEATLQGITATEVLDEAVGSTPVPRESPAA
jgi:MoxR-like ATPase